MTVSRKVSITLVITFASLLIAVALSYANFTKYQPKILKKIEEVKGLKAVSNIELLYPDNVEKVSSSQTEFTSQTTYKTTRTQDQLRFFYKNLLTDLGWQEESIKLSANTMTYKFKKQNGLATINTQTLDGSTLVSLEMINSR